MSATTDSGDPEKTRCIVVREPWYVEKFDQWHDGIRVVEGDRGKLRIEKFDRHGEVPSSRYVGRKVSVGKRYQNALAAALTDFDEVWLSDADHVEDWDASRLEDDA